MYEPLGKWCIKSSGLVSFFKREGRRIRALRAAEATGEAMIEQGYERRLLQSEGGKMFERKKRKTKRKKKKRQELQVWKRGLKVFRRSGQRDQSMFGGDPHELRKLPACGVESSYHAHIITAETGITRSDNPWHALVIVTGNCRDRGRSMLAASNGNSIEER